MYVDGQKRSDSSNCVLLLRRLACRRQDYGPNVCGYWQIIITIIIIVRYKAKWIVLLIGFGVKIASDILPMYVDDDHDDDDEAVEEEEDVDRHNDDVVAIEGNECRQKILNGHHIQYRLVYI